jgi:hypothetical protein
MGDLTIIILSIGMIMICWVMIKINDKIDRHIKKFKKFEQALKKNSTGNVPVATNTQTSSKVDVPMASTSNENRTQGVHLVAKK